MCPWKRVKSKQSSLAFSLAELVRWRCLCAQSCHTAVSIAGLRALPALHGTRTQANLRAGLTQARTALLRLLDQGQQGLALLGGRHQTSCAQ